MWSHCPISTFSDMPSVTLCMNVIRRSSNKLTGDSTDHLLVSSNELSDSQCVGLETSLEHKIFALHRSSKSTYSAKI